ncbi:MAG: multicopper oxidase domain-containing protein [Rhodococcus sp.]|nr:multicopper oxidase domain-containing protein [Rhodococcus sp. (in: high G+C Gram-positive bacteria)]
MGRGDGNSAGRSWTGRIVVSVVVVVALIGAAGASLTYFWSSLRIDTQGAVEFTRPLAIPELASSTVDEDGVRIFDLQMQEGTADLGHGPGTRTWGVNGSYLGPTVRADRGEDVRINVRNELGETSTLHWHGMHLPAAMDGGPHQMVEPGQTWSPQWTINQPAGTLWYHPHLHGSTAEHVYRGIAGMFYIDDPDGPVLPDEYGVDDFPIIVQDKNFDDDQLSLSNRKLSEVGIVGEEILVNGTPGPYLEVTTERVRLRMLNGSNARIFNFGIYSESDGAVLPFTLIGADGGLLPRPALVQAVQLSPGERIDIVAEIPAGTSAVMRSTAPDLGADFWHSRLSGGDDVFDILQLRAAPQLETNTPIPSVLAERENLGEPVEVRQFTLLGTRINEQRMDMNRVDAVIDVGATELWEVTNGDAQPHNFHVHDVQFQVLETDDPMLSGVKDTVYIRPGQTVKLLMRFEDYTDPQVPYMFHCHLLRHEDDGMMGQFVVVREGQEAAVTAPSGHDGHSHP